VWVNRDGDRIVVKLPARLQAVELGIMDQYEWCEEAVRDQQQ